MDEQTFRSLMLCEPFTGPSVKAFAAYLGLEDPDVFARQRAYGRGSGRTTEMLLEAAVAVARGQRVTIAGHSYQYGDRLLSRLRTMVGDLGLVGGLVDRHPPYATSDPRTVEAYRRGRKAGAPPLVFEDHFISPGRERTSRCWDEW